MTIPRVPDADLFLLAMDHRHSLAKDVYGIGGTVTPADAERIAAGKELIFRGLLAALDRGAERSVTGVLVDERYGAEVAARARAAGLRLAMPIEASGHDWFTLEYGDLGQRTWLEHVERFSPDYVKVLVRDNPDFAAGDRRAQMDDLAVVSRTLREAGRTFLVELLVPATADQAGRLGARYDADLRPDLTVQVITEMQQAGVEPGIWKIEGLETAAAAARVVAAAQQGGRGDVRCIVLGRDAPAERLDHWLEIAAPTPGFEGFAIGRSIWEEPLAGHLAGQLGADQLTGRVADNYLHYVGTYRAAEQHPAVG